MTNSKPQVQRVSVKCIIERDGAVLLAQDAKGVWELPGGRINFGETPEEAAKRELMEELHIPPTQVALGKPLDVWMFCVERPEADLQFIILVMVCKTSYSQIEKSQEHQSLGWFSKNEVGALNMRDGYKKSIAKYFATPR